MCSSGSVSEIKRAILQNYCSAPAFSATFFTFFISVSALPAATSVMKGTRRFARRFFASLLIAASIPFFLLRLLSCNINFHDVFPHSRFEHSLR